MVNVFLTLLWVFRAAPIFHFNYEQFRFVYIVKKKVWWFSKKNVVDFQNLKNQFDQAFWRLLDTNRQTDTQTSKVYWFYECFSYQNIRLVAPNCIQVTDCQVTKLYSNNQKTLKYDDDFIAILNYIRMRRKIIGDYCL